MRKNIIAVCRHAHVYMQKVETKWWKKLQYYHYFAQFEMWAYSKACYGICATVCGSWKPKTHMDKIHNVLDRVKPKVQRTYGRANQFSSDLEYGHICWRMYPYCQKRLCSWFIAHFVSQERTAEQLSESE